MKSIGLVLRLFLRSSRIQRKRAFLTIASIAWGTLALLMLLSFGEGMHSSIARANVGMGRDLVVLWPGESSLPYKGMPIGRPIRPRVDDVEALRARATEAETVLGELRSWRASLTHGRKTVNARITGTYPEYGEMRNHIARRGGRFFHDLDMKEKRRVMFLGEELAKDLFGDEPAEGKSVLVDGTPFTVIGVSIHKMQMGTYAGPDAQQAVIPISTFQAQWGSDRINTIVFRAKDPARTQQALDEVKTILGARIGFDAKDPRALMAWNTVESSEIMRNILLGIQLFLGIIGGLTLMIGGVGVANIMYATVKERTREIGVRMALGARPGWVTGPLLLEGVAYTLVGGLFGLLGAVVLVGILGILPTEGNEALELLGKPTLSLRVGAAAAALLGFIGVAAAYFPARRAAAVDPAETLRYE
jgi:putative ABC transport system permease protein